MKFVSVKEDGESMYDVMRVVEDRISVRSYRKRPLPKEIVQDFTQYVEALNKTTGPFGTQPKIHLSSVHLENAVQGNYGFVRNASEYFVGVCKKEKKSVVDFGYNFEKLVLHATSKGLGTCWMAGGFKRSDFETTIEMEEGEYIPAISPVGYSHEKTSVIDQSVRFLVRSNKREPWEKMFFDKELKPIHFNTYHGDMKIPLELVRLAPSGSNKQPWVLVFCEKDQCVHFYSKESYTYQMDLGIAMLHFELGCQEKGYTGSWQETSHPAEITHEYIASFHWKK
jgi:hypothetical protein